MFVSSRFLWRCFLVVDNCLILCGLKLYRYKARSIQIIYCVNIHPACDQCQGTFHHTTADDDHPHGSFVGQYCQGQAQEITVEVILCKYGRQCSRASRLSRYLFALSGSVSVSLISVLRMEGVCQLLLPRRVCNPQLCAMPVLHARAPEQARGNISPCKN